ncbi:MAG: DUF2029 domain-containing protein [Candidatus Eremiobacteraeota bacterium]|nr:DUF2029 domain-containing protein [Candidatus Eremiobacteraeota bacterium]
MNGLARRVTWWAGALALTVLIADLAIPLAIDAGLRACDFAAFYCAGEAVAHGADPYRVMPLAACEHRVATGPFLMQLAVMPAPLPPYVLGALRVVAMVPFRLAQHLLDVVSVGAFGVTVVLLHRLTRIPVMAVLFATAPFAWVVVMLGQPLLVLACALTAAAVLVRQDRDRFAALAASAMMVEPHVGLCVCLSLFLWRKKTRLVLVATGAAGVALAIATVSWPVVREYFTEVLPLHARSEVYGPGQFSLTAILAALGVPASSAVHAGAVQYAVVGLGGVFVARVVAARLENSAALVVVPPLFAVLGGTFIHATDFIFVLPAALLIAAKTPRRAWATAALVGLAAHWKAVGGLPGPLLSVVAATVLVYWRHRSLVPALAVGALFSIAVALCTLVTDAGPVALGAPAAGDFAELAWEQFMLAHAANGADFLIRLPMWGALIVLCALTVELASAGRRDVVPELRTAPACP